MTADSVDLAAVSDRLNEQPTVVSGVHEGRLRVTIRHDEWRTTNLHPSQYERIETALDGAAWTIEGFEVRQKPREEMDREADSDFVVIILELAPAAAGEGVENPLEAMT